MGYRVFGIARNDEDIAEVEAASADANGQHQGSSPNEVLVRIVGTGICQTDAHIRNQDYSTPLPVILRPRGGRRRGVCGLGRRTTRLPRNSICAITIRDSRPTRARSAP
jgi:hypothetical protein